jgi:hypothetical protein
MLYTIAKLTAERRTQWDLYHTSLTGGFMKQPVFSFIFSSVHCGNGVLEGFLKLHQIRRNVL